MKAILVTTEFTVRVITDDDQTDAEIAETARKLIEEQMNTALESHVTNIEEDRECPYGFFFGEG